MRIQQFILVVICSLAISCDSASEDKEIAADLVSSPLTANPSAEKVLKNLPSQKGPRRPIYNGRIIVNTVISAASIS